MCASITAQRLKLLMTGHSKCIRRILTIGAVVMNPALIQVSDNVHEVYANLNITLLYR